MPVKSSKSPFALLLEGLSNEERLLVEQDLELYGVCYVENLGDGKKRRINPQALVPHQKKSGDDK